jgi:hypothetical protein
MSRGLSTVGAGSSTGCTAPARDRLEQRSARARASRVGVAIAVACAVALAIAALPGLRASSTPSPASRAGSASHVTGPLPAGLLAVASVSIGAGERRFWPVRDGGSLLAKGDGIKSDFTASGVRLRVAQGTLDLAPAAIGRGRDVQRAATVAPTTDANRVLYRRGSVGEYYRNGPYGLEQGFTVARRPQDDTGALVLALRLGGSLAPEWAGSQVLFKTRAGAVALRYGQLSAADATGRRLPAAMRLDGGLLRLQVDDSHARYPLRIDPFIQQGPKLTAGSEEKEEPGQFGFSVSLSADGNTALIGVPHFDGTTTPNTDSGAAWVFTRSGSTWTQQGPKLAGAELGIEKAEFGASVALSASGYTALVGAPGRKKVGAAWVFKRTGSTWTQQGKVLTGEGTVGRALLGDSVSLSEDGNTALIGGDGDNSHVGAAWVFTRSGSIWTQDGEKLTGGGESGAARFGRSVVLSNDGHTALLGGPEDDSQAGAVWTFARSGSTWTQDGEKLTGGVPSATEEDTQFGASVALSTEASAALVGSRLINPGGGGYAVAAAAAFTREGSGWSQQGSRLIPLDQARENTYPAKVALSADDSTALLGAPNADGGSWVFTRAGATWTQQGEKLEAGEAISGPEHSKSEIGSGVALSAWGTALVGGRGDHSQRGAAWAYERVQLGCSDSWTNTAGGSWFTSADWSKGAPPGPEEEACITAPGTYTVTVDQTSTTGTVSVRSLTVGGSSGTQTLTVAGTCSQNAVLASAYGIANGWHGAITLTNGDECASDVALSGPVGNLGLLDVEDLHGGLRSIEGDLTNNGTVSLAAGEQLQVNGGYQQTPLGRLRTFIAGASDFGSMSVARGLTLAGSLAVQQTPPFKASPKERFPIFAGSAWQIGKLTAMSGLQISFFPAVYYMPVYHLQPHGNENSLTLVATQVHVTLSPKSGAPGSTVTISGGKEKAEELIPGDTITPTFIDHEGVQTAFPSVTVSPGGTFSTSITIPPSAAVGEGTAYVTSSETGLRVNRSFNVT